MDQRIPIKDSQLEVVIRQQPTKDLVAFDFGIMFEEGSNEVKIYVDDDLQEAIKGMLKIHKKLVFKVNYFSPDVIVIGE